MNPDDFRRLYDYHFVLNHGTDHRAQALASLAQLGMATFSQCYTLNTMGKA
jgi:uncharacterized damage-inducible protein DinB